jgi:hypothetical protein
MKLLDPDLLMPTVARAATQIALGQTETSLDTADYLKALATLGEAQDLPTMPDLGPTLVERVQYLLHARYEEVHGSEDAAPFPSAPVVPDYADIAADENAEAIFNPADPCDDIRDMVEALASNFPHVDLEFARDALHEDNLSDALGSYAENNSDGGMIGMNAEEAEMYGASEVLAQLEEELIKPLEALVEKHPELGAHDAVPLLVHSIREQLSIG